MRNGKLIVDEARSMEKNALRSMFHSRSKKCRHQRDDVKSTIHGEPSPKETARLHSPWCLLSLSRACCAERETYLRPLLAYLLTSCFPRCETTSQGPRID